MIPKKRKKVSRHRGTHTHGRGAKKKARGKGHRGGIGMAGTGKRADHKKSKIIKKSLKYFGRDKVRRGPAKKEIKTVTLEQINENFKSFEKRGIAKENNGVYEFNFKGYKIIGNSKVEIKVKIEAKAASKGAQEAVKKGGGEIVIEVSKKKKVEKKGENVETHSDK